ncbi:SDR family NAD(P)-dependent oxidoreductase [Phytomonospora sp. NPDC050363]|uniref:SDR family NAD(P)-dependent oxidoreductase n=1 Tax=Phytomonospora sp. NPDC050363 TaxID=3155642 RepID=UPI0033F40546
MPLRSSLLESAVVVTGATSGIGAATALLLAERGARLVLAARDERALDTMADACRRRGGDAVGVLADTADTAAVTAIAEAAEDAYGRLDAWVQSAGVAYYGHLADMPAEHARRLLDVNVLGYLYAAQTAVRHMRRDGGVIVMIGSGLSEMCMPYLGLYNASKHAVAALGSTLRQELGLDGPHAISVCTLMPAAVDTPLFDRAANHSGKPARPPGPPVGAWRAARRVVRLVTHPRRRAHVGVAGAAAGLASRAAPLLTERALALWGRFAVLDASESTPVTDGNLFEPDGHEVRVTGEHRQEDPSRHTGSAPWPTPVT